MAIIVTAVCRLGKDAEVKNLSNGGVVTVFSAATDAGYGQNKQTIWFDDCAIFGDDGTRIAAHLTKGKQVMITGEFSEREHNGRVYKKLKVTSLSFISSGRSNDSNGNSYEAPAPSAPKPAAPAPQPQQEEREEDLPF